MHTIHLFALVGCLLLISVPGGSSGSEAEVREATYVGASYLEHGLNEQCAEAIGGDECPMRIPRGVIATACEGEGHPWTLGLYDGINGVLFCDVPISTVRVSLEDDAHPQAVGSLFCVTDGHGGMADDHVKWPQRLAVVEGSATVTIPWWCENEGPGITDLYLIMHAGNATAGTVYLSQS